MARTKKSDAAETAEVKKTTRQRKTKKTENEFVYEYGDDVKKALAVLEPHVDKIYDIFSAYISTHVMSKDEWNYLYGIVSEMSEIVIVQRPFVSFDKTRLVCKFSEKHSTIYHVRAEAHAKGFVHMVDYMREYGDGIEASMKLNKMWVAAGHIFYFLTVSEK